MGRAWLDYSMLNADWDHSGVLKGGTADLEEPRQLHIQDCGLGRNGQKAGVS